MINEQKVQTILESYRNDFEQRWSFEKYKWEAVRQFQLHWNIKSRNFEEMFTDATAKTKDLLTATNYYPRAVMRGFAAINRDMTKAIFANLFNEQKDLIKRIERFLADVEHIRQDYGEGIWRQHYQNLNAVSTYLWLRYPDTYYLYNFVDCYGVAKELDSSFVPRHGGQLANLIGAYEMYGEICRIIAQDKELRQLFLRLRTPSCWPDKASHIMTADFCRYVSRRYAQPSAEGLGEREDKIQIGPEGASVTEQDSALCCPYTKGDFIKDVYLDSRRTDALLSLLRHKKNVILQGPPGVGKTYAARRLAYTLMGEKDDSRIEFVHFHENYRYEDFLVGYKPQPSGYSLQYGMFYRFCQHAAAHRDKAYFFIIDDINRGNISQIFGEAVMLIEQSYRDVPITLACDGLPFAVPDNVYIIGMMSTADKETVSDFVMRRRFVFFELTPEFDSDGFHEYEQRLDSDTFVLLIDRIKLLNHEISKDPKLGKGFCIGHGYFCGQAHQTEEGMSEIVEYEILPLLQEYWPDNPEKVRHWGSVLRSLFYE